MNDNKLFALAKQYVDESKFDKALEIINKCIELEPEGKDNYLIRGEIYLHLKQGDNSLNDFSKVLQLDPNNSEAHLNRAIVYYNILGKKDLAITEFNQAIEKDPENAKAYHCRGIYKRIERKENALDDFDKAIEFAPNEPAYYHSRAFLYQDRGYHKEAIVDFNRCIELNPNVALYFSNRGTSYFLRDKLDLALKDFNKAVELDPDDSLPHINRAVVTLNSGNYNSALCDYYYIDKNDIDIFISGFYSKCPNINPHKLLTNYHKVKDVTNKYQLNIPQGLALLKAQDFAKYWLLQTWRQLVTGKDINNQNVALSNNTTTLPPEIYRLITSFIIECADRDIDKLVWAMNKRLHDDVIDTHNKKIGVKLSNSANKFLTLFKVKTTPDNFQQIAEERFNRRLDF